MIKVLKDEQEVILMLVSLIEKIAVDSIAKNNNFKVGFSGGSLVKFLCLALPKIKTDFSKWIIFFCDERVVPTDSSDSTFGVYKQELLNKIKIPLKEEQFIQIKQNVSAKEAAKDYDSQLKHIFGTESIPKFDLLLLGMGPDGHTCSLFPGHPLLEEKESWVMPITNSPKPPPNRITLTYPVINNAKNCIFALTGEGKANMVKRILVDKEDLPAGRVQPGNGNLYWIIDKSAAKFLPD